VLCADDQPSSAAADDVHHAADLIRQKLVHENSRPDKALHFSNLYSRLLSQPVLDRKWAILYFLYRLSHSEAEALDAAPSPTPHPQPPLRQQSSDAPAFNDAFSRNGLPRVTDPDEPEPVRLPQTRERMPLRASTRSVEASPEPASSANPPDAPTEAQLLRDLPFTLQGLSSTNLAFSESSLKLPSTLPVPIISLLHTLAEPSLLYRSLSSFVESSQGGLVGQSLRSAIGVELRAYLGLVATLEAQIRRALTQLQESPGNLGLGKAGVTLKRCVVWTREATMGLRLMSMMVEEAKGNYGLSSCLDSANILTEKKGGELISLIHSYASSHGDPFVYTFAERLLIHVTRPFYTMLQHWIYDGELEDPFLEFFVYQNRDADSESDPRRGGATSVWEDKYRLKDSMIPTIITQDFANKVYLIGKSLNFIRYGCGDSAWVEKHSKSSMRELRYGDTATLESSIDSAYKGTMARLIHLMEDKFKLFEHLAALKKYLLLGQGDFVALLMESLASNLDRPANSQYRHTLTAQLEHAIRNSNAQYDSPDVLRRLDARMLELSHGEIGWDVFTLEYRVDSPLDVIVTPWASKQYLKVFNFLWRVKRVEFALGSTWRRTMTGARGVLGAVGDKVDADWKNARGGIAEMIHFVSQLQHYILFEVIEAGWEGLQKAMRTPDATLDDLISAHGAYLRSITRKGLLAPSGSQASSSTAPDFTAQLHELLKLMLAYKDAVDSLYSFSVAEFTRRQDLAAKIETRTAAGTWGVTEKDDLASSHMSGTNKHRTSRRDDNDSPIPPLLPLTSGNAAADEAAILSSLRQRLSSLASDFRVRVNILLGDLAYQPDVDMRFLGVVMNFNDVYSPVRRHHHHGGGAGGARRKTNAREAVQQEREGAERDKGKGRERERVKRTRDDQGDSNGGASKDG
jgi:gamma-tubulin complex component 3